MDRGTRDMPIAASGIELAENIPSLDLENYRRALKAYGVSDKRLEKLKALDGLARDGAMHLAISLRVTHQSYDGQLHNLAEVAEDIKERMKGTQMEDGTIKPLDSESYSYLAKVYVECVKEAGKGFGLMMSGTEAIVRMTMAAKNKNGGGGGAAAPGWGPMKKVRPEQNSDNAND